MKNIFFIAFLIIVNLKCSAQINKSTWLPQDYVKAILSKNVNAPRYLIPIEGFQDPFNKCLILTYGGELNPIQTKKVVINGKEKYQLFNVEYYINQKYNSKELVNRMAHAVLFISKIQDKILLEIVETDKKEEIYFIDRTEGYIFKDIRKSKQYLQKQ